MNPTNYDFSFYKGFGKGLVFECWSVFHITNGNFPGSFSGKFNKLGFSFYKGVVFECWSVFTLQAVIFKTQIKATSKKYEEIVCV